MSSSIDVEKIAGKLRAAGIRLSPEEIAERLAAMAAAPSRCDPLEAMVLLAPEMPTALAEAVRAAVEERRAHYARQLQGRAESAVRLARLRAEMKRRGLDGFMVPRGDEHQGEQVPPGSERLAWLTGFSGSAGLAIVLAAEAAIFVDGRYSLQVQGEVDVDLFKPRHIIEQPPADWIKSALAAGQKLGYDPWLHGRDGLKRLDKACAAVGAELVAVETNPIDAVWTDRPPAPLSPVVPHPLDYAGESAQSKRARVAEALAGRSVDAAVLTLPESIAWLLNVRGGDVPHTPLALSFAIVRANGRVDLIIDRRKLTPGLAEHLGNEVAVHDRHAFAGLLDELGTNKATVLVDPATAGAWIGERLSAAGATVRDGTDPCLAFKACKNETEIAGARAAHVRDGVALVRFLHWLEENGLAEGTDEAAAAEKLKAFRMENELIRDLSFATISGAGPNGAVVHYRVSAKSNRKLEPGTLYLVDSGAQYLDGTTDVTRTVALGPPTAEMRDRFTRVLKGHIAIATARFPEGTEGGQIDAFARHALWQAGLDYDHGTGHGVGSYLGVHEGPQRISKASSGVALKEGMIVSNEPGYYKAEEYGIRIENLVVVRPAADQPGERKLLEFETLTRAPIDLALVEASLLTDQEVAWLNDYHATVRRDVGHRLARNVADWLEAKTAPIRR